MSERDSQYISSTSGFRKKIEAGQLITESNYQKLDQLIRENGFDVFGVVPASSKLDFKRHLNEFLDNNHHGDMKWMYERSHLRSNPKSLWDQTKSIIVLGVNYHYNCNSLELLSNKEKGIVSVYSRNNDYHKIIKKNLKHLSVQISDLYDCDYKYFIDTAPVMEKPIGMLGGIGWQGKHTNLVSKDFGSWLFLSTIFVDKEIVFSEPEVNHCGSCSDCIDICPTGAIIEPYKLDARKCISYLTIEHKGKIDKNLRSLIGNRIYGCDDCLAVCPWNKFAKLSNEKNFHPKAELIEPDLKSFIKLDDTQFREKFSGSSIKRIGRDRFIRNVLIAVGNSKNKVFIEDVKDLLHDESSLVRSMAVWALKQIADTHDFNNFRKEQISLEVDKDVKAEWLD